MRRCTDHEQVKEQIDKLNNYRRSIRKTINQVALFSNGSYTLQDMYNMPMYFLEEIKETMIEKAETEKQNMQKGRKQTF